MAEDQTAYSYFKEANHKLSIVIGQNEKIEANVNRLVVLVDGSEDLGVVGLRQQFIELRKRVGSLELKFWLAFGLLVIINIALMVLNVYLLTI